MPLHEGETSAALAQLQARWTDVLAEVRGKSFKAEAALRSSCRPVKVDAELVTIAFRYEFHKDMIEDPEHQAAVEQAISTALGRPHRMRCVLLSDLSAVDATPIDRRRAVSVEESGAAQEPDSPPEVSAEAAPPAEEMSDPVVQEAIESYGAKLVKVTTRR
jgi:hypothetical protein